ncbi:MULTISPECIES: 2-polyprenyl-3-methyl-6-methoxy-1,4-benzoquinone monooxygenase [unclassified Uliginosibacterium]|uniref:2-polyprenyl-3-methyl-6-methoxy-1,4-benzoquinone monooxygenase n=1 Tax=unclassified Uliginosibacterium TaxID=2621521 RepID=UPI000C7C70F5|nr:MULTISPECIES: 2-polyprenyl-3-methyl-6-methoxy-1,4-benzoquinone monooxygenase [unclassified Uliginosibacterium]MDO6384674.1 2-polyprenyl-3-methyl-6-methoxy-1,4-benzoquinone monooxygenase [Uliginosibacterium sp. 31-12]PLK48391.1 demethoxyubiquinone hydroxylase family protein [Uliginosibacterium sp. TH139]
MLDRLIISFDRALRTLAAEPRSMRAVPGAQQPEAVLDDSQRKHVAGLMRINHVGEICAQALYQGQALTARTQHSRSVLEHAADEETEHLAWTLQRIRELGGRPSLLNPLWYGGALAIGVGAGLAGDRWSLGFLAETEKQVEAHLDSHLGKVPQNDLRSREILEQMRSDEIAHAEMAQELGGAALPGPVQEAMRLASRVMTTVAYRV